MKRNLIAALTAVCLLAAPVMPAVPEMMTVLTVHAEESGTCGENLTWTLDADGTLTVSGTGEMTGYNGNEDQCSPFNSLDSVRTLILEPGVTSIGDETFRYCINLTSVTIPDSVTSIGRLAFGGCTSLTSVTIPDSVTSIGRLAFSECTNLTSAAIPESVTSIGAGAFRDCTRLTSVTIPESVTSIGVGAFYCCTHLTAVTILNPKCGIGDSIYTFSNDYDNGNDLFTGTIYGYAGSTAPEYAEKYRRRFEVISSTPTEPAPGDVNGDGTADIMDCIALNKFLVGAGSLNDTQRKAADLTGDGNITADDSLALLKAVLGIQS